ncbi:MAG: hypothetical protein QW835_02675 [Candidatus Hadarchaeum sp.]
MKDGAICAKTQYGTVVFHATALRLEVPELGVNIEGAPRIIERFVNGFFQEKLDARLFEALQRMSKLSSIYHSRVFERLEKDIDQALRDLIAFQQFEERGYWFFPVSKQLLIKPVDYDDAFLIQFEGTRRATCRNIFQYFTSDALIEGMAKGMIAHTPYRNPYIPAAQAALVEKAVEELQLPYREVAEIIGHISMFRREVDQRKLFQKLSEGFNPEEMQRLKTKASELARKREINQRYVDAQRQNVFLEEKELLFLPENDIMISLSEDVEIFKIDSEVKFEIGRYIVTGKWGRTAKIRRVNPEEISRIEKEKIIEGGKSILAALPEPYRERLSILLVSLSMA